MGEVSGKYTGSVLSIYDYGGAIYIGEYRNDTYTGRFCIFLFICGDSEIQGKILGDKPGYFLGGYLLLSEEGGIIVIGADKNNKHGNNQGYVYAYHNSKKGQWTQLGQDIWGDNVYYWLGQTLTISSDITALDIWSSIFQEILG